MKDLGTAFIERCVQGTEHKFGVIFRKINETIIYEAYRIIPGVALNLGEYHSLVDARSNA